MDLLTLTTRLRDAGCVFAEDEARLLTSTARDAAQLSAMVARRVAGTPLEQVVGFTMFLGERVAVGEGVFVPRRRTELLAELAIVATPSGGVVVDLCTGAGAVALAVARARPGAVVHAVDLDPTAVRWATQNLAPVGASVHAGDLYAALPASLRGSVDVLAANAPYVPRSEIALMPREARLHEPAIALDGGPDGLDVHRRIAADAAGWLAPGGTVLIETSARQADGTSRPLRERGFVAKIERCEDREATVVVATPGIAAC
jgi:release factor glutamine methyltransferase